MKKIFSKIMTGCRYILFWAVCLLLPIRKNRIVFSNFFGKGYGDSPKYIADRLLQLREDLQLIWLVNDFEVAKSVPQGIIPCKNISFKAIYYLATARIWVHNVRLPFIFHKRKGQYYIQTWHGFALKRIEKDVEDKLSKGYVKAAKKDSDCIDAIVSDSEFMTKIYKASFWYDGNVLQYGSPRNDIIFSQDNAIKTKVCSALKLPDDVKLVLYAPTFRSDGSLDVYDLDYLRLKATCEKRFGGQFAVLVRLHPNVMEKSSDLSFDGTNVLNASFYPDIQELLAAADVVISDYSSLMFDFALSYKPCFQYATDIDEYKEDRNFYFALDQLPFSLATSNDELEEKILTFDTDNFRRALEEFYASVGMISTGDSAKKCAELISSKIK